MHDPRELTSPAVSFVIPAHDEELLLPRTLDSIHATARELRLDYEIVVVVDASTDRTGAIAAERGARVVRVDYRRIAATRNAEARAASGALLVFVDADTILPVGPMAGALGVLASGGLAGGSACAFGGAIPGWARALDRFAKTRGRRFTIVRSPIVTSGRKLRAYTARELLGTLALLAVRGRRGARRRENFEMWYGPRRADPEGLPRTPRHGEGGDRERSNATPDS